MNDDIVARLRVLNHHAKKLAENESLHDLHREAFTRCENLTLEAADEIERLRAERDEARRRTNSILTEIDCRIEHGAESNGHLEVLRDMFKENTDE